MASAFSLSTVPRHARLLGIAGLIPFAGLAVLVWVAPTDIGARTVAVVQLAYAVTIASFLGGVHWGVAFAELGDEGEKHPRAFLSLLWGVTPSLIAWAAFLLAVLTSLTALPAAMALMIALLAGCWWIDRSFLEPSWWPTRYMPLRTLLTAGATGSLFVGFLGLVART